jgi:excisionase family DNA binding protein
MEEKPKQQYLSIEEVAEITGMKSVTWRRWIADRRIEHVRLGRAIRIPRSALEKFLEQSTVKAERVITVPVDPRCIPLTSLDITRRPFGPLYNAGFNSLGEVADAFSDGRLERLSKSASVDGGIRNFGKATLEEVRRILLDYGLIEYGLNENAK